MKALIIFSFLLLWSNNMIHSQSCSFENYYLSEEGGIDHGEPFWLPVRTETQGITNDGKNWFITTTKYEENNRDQKHSGSKIWKVPKSVHLGAGSSNNPNIKSISMDNIPVLINNGYWHFGDLDHYNYNGIDYLLVPITGEHPITALKGRIIACFNAETLNFISYAKTNMSSGVGWCAIDPNGNLYTSPSTTDEIRRFEVDWDKLISGDPEHNSLSKPVDFQLKFPNRDYDNLISMQGGEFTPSGELLYVTSGAAGGCLPCVPGIWDCDGCGALETKVGPGSPKASDGIHVFETSGWKEIKTSKNVPPLTIAQFMFNFDNDLTGEQPQGLTIWDLDDGSAPNGIRGKLHVLIHDYDYDLFGDNHEVSLRHFSNVVHVSKLNTSGIGTSWWSHGSFNEAYDFYPIWNGAEIKLKAGVYSDTGVYDKCILITSEGGSAIIGKQ